MSELWASLLKEWDTGVPALASSDCEATPPMASAEPAMPSTPASGSWGAATDTGVQSLTFRSLLGSPVATRAVVTGAEAQIHAFTDRIELHGVEVVRPTLGLPSQAGRVTTYGFGGWEDDFADDLDLRGGPLDVAKVRRVYRSGNADLVAFLHGHFDRHHDLVQIPDPVTGSGVYYSPRTDPASWSAPDVSPPQSTYRDTRPCIGLEESAFDEPVAYRLNGDDYAVWWPACAPADSGLLARESLRPEGWQGIGLMDSRAGGGVLEFLKRDLALTLDVHRLSPVTSATARAGLRSLAALMAADNVAGYVPVRFDSWLSDRRVFVGNPRRDPRDGVYQSLRQHALALFWYPNRLGEAAA